MAGLRLPGLALFQLSLRGVVNVMHRERLKIPSQYRQIVGLSVSFSHICWLSTQMIDCSFQLRMTWGVRRGNPRSIHHVGSILLL